MRTTVTLDPDVERLVRQAMQRSQKGFKETLNAAIRKALARKAVNGKRFVVKPKAMGLRSGLDPLRLNQLADDLEVEAFLEKQKRRA